MQSPASALPQAQVQKGDDSSSNEDRRQLQALDTSSSRRLVKVLSQTASDVLIAHSSSRPLSSDSNSSTIQAEDAKVDTLWIRWQADFQAYSELHDELERLESILQTYQQGRDAASEALDSFGQVEGLRPGLQEQLNIWQRRLDDTTNALAKVQPQEEASKALWEETKRQYRQAVNERVMVVRERNGRLKEESMN